MIYCEYDKHFMKIKEGNRIKSIPVLKNTCIECKYKMECSINKSNNPRRNNEIIIQNLLLLKDNIKDEIKEYYRIKDDIGKGLYSDSYVFDLKRLDEVSFDSVVYEKDEDNLLIEYTVKEYLEKYPHHIHKTKLVGYKKVEKVSDVIYGLNIVELESDLEYVNEQLRYYNRKNGVMLNV